MKKIITFTQKTSAAVAGMALVFSMFGYGFAAQAQTATTTTTTTVTVAPFTRDLTLGSTGTDVYALQSWLMANGYSIPAGPTTYFGAQTRAAVAAYQTAHGIQPNVGYFGPITRTSINAMLSTAPAVPGCTPGAAYSSTTGQPCSGTSVSTVPGCLPGYAYSPTTGQSCTTGNNNTSTALSGGEANLRNYDLRTGDDLAEGDSDTEIASAQFDVNGGDINVQRVTVELTPTLSSNSASERPWNYFDQLSVYDGNTRIGSVDAGSRSDWDEQDDDSDHSGSNDYYSIDIPVNGIIREGDTAELSIRADAQNNIDSSDMDQTFNLDIPDNGIRAVDAAGIQQYTGDTGDTVRVGFDEEANGDLTVRASSDNPRAGVFVTKTNSTSDEQDVLAGEIRNRGDADADVTDMKFTVDTNASADLSDMIRRATLDIGGDTYRGDVNDNGTIDFDDLDVNVDSDDTVDFTLSIQVSPMSLTGFDEGDTIRFTLDGDDIEAEGDRSGDVTDVSGSVNGNTFTFSTTGIDVDGTNTSSSVTTLQTVSDSYGTYTVRFDVTAGDDDIYVPTGAGTSASNSNGVLYTDDAANAFSGSAAAVLTSTADKSGTGNAYYVVRAGDTETFTLTVTLNPNTSGTYEVDMTDLYYNTTGSTSGAGSTLVDFNTSNNGDFQTNPVYIPS